MDGTMMIIATLVLIFTIGCLIFKAMINNSYETDNLKHSVKRLEGTIAELYSDYHVINSKIKEYDREMFTRKIKELCEKHKLIYKTAIELVDTDEVVYSLVTYTRSYYVTVLRIQAESLPTEFLRELSKLCEYELLESKSKGIIDIKINSKGE